MRERIELQGVYDPDPESDRRQHLDSILEERNSLPEWAKEIAWSAICDLAADRETLKTAYSEARTVYTATVIEGGIAAGLTPYQIRRGLELSKQQMSKFVHLLPDGVVE